MKDWFDVLVALLGVALLSMAINHVTNESTECPHCDGVGQWENVTCSECQGTGEVQK